jgi:hypothetical protein
MAKSADPKTLAQQLGALTSLVITSEVRIARSCLYWRGELQPSPLSLVYTAALAYRFGGSAPRVKVLRPELRQEGVETLPHVLSGDALCLCFPWQWDDGKLISRTILPWASEWLLHFELWRVDRVWHGGGHEPALGEAV